MNPTQHPHHHYLCDDCEMEIAEHDFVGSCDVVYRLCTQCKDEAQELQDEARMREEDERRANLCERCHEKPSRVYIYRLTKTGEEEELHLCEHCEDWDEREQEEDLGVCQSCRHQDAEVSFLHLTNGNFELCERCFQAATHEPDYGKDFVKEEQ